MVEAKPIEAKAQYGEDLILWEIFKHKPTGTCIEVGAFDGVHMSNTYFFEVHGWDCALVEPDPQLFAEIQRNRKGKVFNLACSSKPGTLTINLARGVEALNTLEDRPEILERIRRYGGTLEKATIETRPLDELIDELGWKAIDFITIDVEGHERAVLDGFTLLESIKPRILLIEDNSNLTDDSLPRYLSARGYVRFRRTGCNDWYARHDDRELVNPASRLRLMGVHGQMRLKNALLATALRLVPPPARKALKSLRSALRSK